MTEIAVDSAVATEQPSDTPPTESTPEMGAGFMDAEGGDLDSGTTGAEQPAAGDGEVAVAAPTPTNQDTPTPQQQTDDEGGTLRMADYTRKMQDVADQRRALEAREAQIAEQQRVQVEATTRLTNQLQASQPAAPDPVQALAAQLGPEEARGLTVVDQLIQERAVAIADRQVAAALEPYKPYLDQLGTTTGMVSQVAEQQNAAARNNARAQIEAAEAIFGKVDAWDARHRAIAAGLTKQENPDTGEAFTVAEAMSLATGRRIADQQDAVSQQRQARNSAKRSITAQAGSPTLAEAGGTITRAQALQEIATTM